MTADAQTPRTAEDVFDTHGRPGSGCPNCAELQRELAAVRGQLEETQKHCDRLTGMKFSDRMHAALVDRAERAESALAAAKAEANSLKEALEKYGEHDVGCALLGTHEPCSCGLDNILDAITKE